MAPIERLTTFDPRIESWYQYSIQLKVHFTIKDADDEENKIFLYTLLGPEELALLTNLVSPLPIIKNKFPPHTYKVCGEIKIF